MEGNGGTKKYTMVGQGELCAKGNHYQDHVETTIWT